MGSASNAGPGRRPRQLGRDAIRRYEARDRILASLYVNLAVALHEQNQHEAAIRAVARALGLPNHPAYDIIQGVARLDP